MIDSTTRKIGEAHPELLNEDETSRLENWRPGLGADVEGFVNSVQLPELYVVQAVAFAQNLEIGAPPVFAGEFILAPRNINHRLFFRSINSYFYFFIHEIENI